MTVQHVRRVRPGTSPTSRISPRGRRRVLVIGGSGFVGRAVDEHCRASGDDVVVAGRHLPTDRSFDAPGSSSSAARLTLDLLRMSPESLAERMDSVAPDVVVNTVGSIWGRTDDEMWSAATLPTFNLLSALTRSSSAPMLVHLGTVLEYGRLAPGTTADPGSTPRPDSAYGRAKLAASTAVVEAHRRGDVEGCVLRVSNVCGPGAPRISLLGQVTEALLDARRTGRTAEVRMRPLTAHRDYVDVRDVADAVRLAGHPSHGGLTLDIGRGEAVGVRDLVELLIDVSGVPAHVIETGPAPTADDWMRVDPRPSREALGWIPTRRLRTSLMDYWEAVCAEVGADADAG